MGEKREGVSECETLRKVCVISHIERRLPVVVQTTVSLIHIRTSYGAVTHIMAHTATKSQLRQLVIV